MPPFDLDYIDATLAGMLDLGFIDDAPGDLVVPECPECPDSPSVTLPSTDYTCN